MKERKTILQKVPIVIMIMTIMLLSLFAIDAFNSKFSEWEQVRSFFLRIIPSIILIAILIFIWRRSLIGGLLFILIGCAGGFLLFQNNINAKESLMEAAIPPLVLAIPFLLSGFAFVINHYRKRNG